MNRQLKFLIGAIVIGVLLIGVSMLMENTSVEKTEVSDHEMGSNFQALESKIKAISAQSYQSSVYVNINTEIHASFAQKLITQAGEQNLKLQLKEIQSKLLFRACESFLNGNTSNSDELIGWLNDYARSFPMENQAKYYKSQINAYNYYAVTLPTRIDLFVNKKCFDDYNSNKLINEISNMTSLDSKYSTLNKFQTIKQQKVTLLKNYRSSSFDAYGPCVASSKKTSEEKTPEPKILIN